METVVQSWIRVNKVNVTGSVLDAIVIVSLAMAEIVVYTLVMDMWLANVLVK